MTQKAEKHPHACGMAGAASLVINSDCSILESFGCFSCIFFSCFLVIFFFRQIPSHGNTAEVVLTALHRYNYNDTIIYHHWSYINLFLNFLHQQESFGRRPVFGEVSNMSNNINYFFFCRVALPLKDFDHTQRPTTRFVTELQLHK